jgi:hypothetical protein
LSIGVNVNITATAVTTAADIADDARYDPAANVDGSPSPAALGDNADDWGAGNTSVEMLGGAGVKKISHFCE